MRDVIVVLKYSMKYWKQGLLNLIFNIFSTFFALFSFTLIMPFLQILFDKEQLITALVPWEMSFDAIKHNLFYYLSLTITENGKLSALIFVSVLIVIATLLKSFFAYMASFFMAPVMNGTVRDLQKSLYWKILNMPIGYFSNERKGDIMSRASNDLQEIKQAVTNLLEVLMRDPITIIFFLLYLISLSSSLTLFVFIFIPVIGLIIGKIGKSLKKSSLKGQIKVGEINTSIEETLGGLRIIKAFNAEKIMKTRYTEKVEELFRIMNKVIRRNSLSSPLSEFLGTLVIVAIIIYGGTLVIGKESTFTGEEFITFIVVFSQILNPAKSLSKAYYGVKRGAASIERVEEVLNAENNIIEKENPEKIEGFNASIQYKNVSFKYQDAYVLNNINLTIEKGKTIAFVGQSGSGKSTMVDLLPRFYDIEEGELLIDGINVKNLGLRNLRSLMGNVNQEAVLFNDTIFNNIAFGLDNVKEEDVIEAAKIANAHDFIMETEDGYQTNIGDRGSKLSGGQRQRLSIARAVLKNPPIMILDEATSALDSESERLVQEALQNLMKNRTSIVIAHRLSTIRHADKIIVLDKGQIIEAGTHDELMANGSTYKKLHDLQFY